MENAAALNEHTLNGHNPYKYPVGSELDAAIHKLLFDQNSTGNAPQYSTDERQAEKVKIRLRQLFGHSVTTGRTGVKHKPHFARFESGASTSTEVLAETYPAALCRLALVIAPHRERRS